MPVNSHISEKINKNRVKCTYFYIMNKGIIKIMERRGFISM